MQALLGIGVLLGFAWLVSEDRRGVAVRGVAVGLTIQFALALVLLRFEPVRNTLLLANHVVYGIEAATRAGTSFVFGFLGGAEPPFEVTAASQIYIFAFRILPQIIVFSVLVALLWYWRILPYVIRGFAWILRRTLGVGGAVGVAGASSVFLGMVEAPLVIRAYLKNLSRSEFFVVMTCGMSTVAGSIMVLYANVLKNVIDGALGHILIASVVNVIGAIVVARIMIPSHETTAAGDVADALKYDSLMDAITRGTTDGLRLAINVGAMLIALVSLIALVNALIASLVVGGEVLTLERIMGWLFAPVAWLIGIPWVEANQGGALLGTKLVLNELVAFIQLGSMPPAELTEHTRVILTYTLCGFANFGSLGIMLGGIGALVPERRSELFVLAPKTLISGTIVNCITGAIAGLVYAAPG
jgi:concentrative nucleoside transporter, CNT family